MRQISRSPNKQVLVELDGNTLHWATKRYVPNDLLARIAASREDRPLPDRMGGWKKAGEVPLALADFMFRADLSPDEKMKRLKKLLNDNEFQKFRAVNGRV